MIIDIYDELKRLGVVEYTTEFSRDWLGMGESYMRCLRANNRQPSARAIARCAISLRNASEKLRLDPKSKVRAAGARLEKLAEHCMDEILRVSSDAC